MTQMNYTYASALQPLIYIAYEKSVPLVDKIGCILHHIKPDTWWMASYLFLLGGIYLFHSPFRTQRSAANDFYARFTKILQAWTLIIITFFHIGPQVIQQKQQQIYKGASQKENAHQNKGNGAGEDDAILTSSLLLLPLFFIITHFFMFIHKMKRRWFLGITYFPNLSTLFLNSLLLTVFGALHYECFSHLYGTEAQYVRWRPLQLLRPLFSVPRVLDYPCEAMVKLFAICVFFVVLDYQYKKFRGFDPERGILWSGHYDLKTKRDDSIRITETSQKRKPHIDWRELEPLPRRFNSRAGGTRRRKAYDSVSTKDSVSVNESPTSLKEVPFFSRSGSTRSSSVDRLKGSTICSENFINMNINAPSKSAISSCERKATYTMLRRVASRLENAFFAGRHRVDSTHLGDQPDNLKKLGGTANQAPATVRGMSFAPLEADVRDIQRVKHPINRPGMVPWWSTFVFSTAWQVFANGALKFLSFDVRPLQVMIHPKVFNLSFTPSVKHFPSTGLALVHDGDDAPCAEDVWFDWIADIGDGFNSTYEMARRLAQPTLTAQTREGVSFAGDTFCNETLAAPAKTKKLEQSQARTQHPRQSQRKGQVQGQGQGRRVTSSQLRRISSHRSHSASALAGGGRAALDVGKRSFDDSIDAYLRRRRTAMASLKGSVLFPLYHRMKNRQQQAAVTLPRGSFVVVGGDLAYPNPNDETYKTRLFEPYEDALRGNHTLRRVFFEERHKIIAEDPEDKDMVHIQMLDAATVARLACSDSTLCTSRSSVEEVLGSIPMFFAIPGNHDWFDGLSTFRKYITEKTWIGGWLMPQRSSFFALKLPYNWFMLCTDTGNEQDIDTVQRNYFLDVIDKYMDDSSCVILAAHEPGWLYDAMAKRTGPLQPEINRVILHLGTRLRLHIAGDIHHYSRHIPCDPLSEAPTLIVSGGGGAFLHGARNDKIISQGTRYTRACAFPSSNAYAQLFTHLFGFRLINWKFDLILGVYCFGIIYSLLPVPSDVICDFKAMSAPQMFLPWIIGTTRLISSLLSHAITSLVFVIFSVYCFSTAGSDRQAPIYWRVSYGIFWTGVVVFASCSVLSMLHVQHVYMSTHGMLLSTATQWRSLVEEQAQAAATALFEHTCRLLGADSLLTWMLRGIHGVFVESFICQWICIMVRTLDPLETLAHLMLKIQSNEIGKFKVGAANKEIAMYYTHILFFYWIFVTPIVSFIIGSFLLVSVTMFDYMYDSTYSAFQIEDFKHFVRFRIDAETRALHGYVLAEGKVPKVWELDPLHTEQLFDSETKHTVPHLWRYPSRWCPSVRYGQKPPKIEIIETFTISPHSTGV